MRTLGLITIAIFGFGLSGCSQISGVFKKKPKTQTDAGAVTYADNQTNLRSSPQQSYQFGNQEQNAAGYTGISPFAGYQVELFNTQPIYSVPVFTDPRDAEFVKLNGESELIDWQNCESQNRGYLYRSEYDFSLNPGFEVCMRNKGYVLTTEYGPTTKPALNAQLARLRGPIQFSQTGSAYPGYF